MFICKNAPLAQLVEQLTLNQWVQGSSPWRCTSYQIVLFVYLVMLSFLKKDTIVESKIYIITKIEGEYAYLKDEKDASAEELFIALYLLPQGTDIGTRLLYDFPDFTIL